MKKPRVKTRKHLDFSECTNYINQKYKIDTRDYAKHFLQFAEWCKVRRFKDIKSQARWDEFQDEIRRGITTERPYQDFWQWLTAYHYINLNEEFYLELELLGDASVPKWAQEIYSLYLKEFGKGPYIAKG